MKKALPSPPYPAEIRAKGFTLQIDWERIEQSSTWVKCPDVIRPWLLMLWTKSWLQVPAGSYPNDDEEIAALIRMDDETFAKNRARLMRGWYLASDGRMYHAFITTLVLAMAEKREKDRKRVADYRAKHPKSGEVTRDTDERSENTDGRSREYDTGTETGTGTGTETVTGTGTGNSVPIGTGGEPPKRQRRRREDMTSAEIELADLWSTLKATLVTQETSPDAKAAGALLGKLASKYGKDVFEAAMRETLAQRPGYAHTYLVELCEIAAGRRQTFGKPAPLSDEERQVINDRNNAAAMQMLAGANGEIIDA